MGDSDGALGWSDRMEQITGSIRRSVARGYVRAMNVDCLVVDNSSGMSIIVDATAQVKYQV
jgi:hypothetical protein